MFSMRNYLQQQHYQATGGEWIDDPAILLAYCDDLLTDKAFGARIQQLNTGNQRAPVPCGRQGCTELFIPTSAQHAARRGGKTIYHSRRCYRLASYIKEGRALENYGT